VLAAFLVWTVPSALGRIVRGDLAPSAIAWPAIVGLLLGGGIREARAWRRHRTAQAI
jgi:hypothetical protein